MLMPLGLGSAEGKLIRFIRAARFKLSHSFGLGEMRPDNLIDVYMGGAEIGNGVSHVAVLTFNTAMQY